MYVPYQRMLDLHPKSLCSPSIRPIFKECICLGPDHRVRLVLMLWYKGTWPSLCVASDSVMVPGFEPAEHVGVSSVLCIVWGPCGCPGYPNALWWRRAWRRDFVNGAKTPLQPDKWRVNYDFLISCLECVSHAQGWYVIVVTRSLPSSVINL